MTEQEKVPSPGMGDPAPTSPPRWLLMSMAIGLNLVWALSYPVSKGMIGDLSPLALAGWRIGGAAILLLPFLRRQDIPSRPSLRDLFLLLVMGLIGCGAAIVLQFVGTAKTTASNVSLLVGLETSMVVLLAAVFLGEAIRWKDIVSLVLAFIGVVILTVDPSTLDLMNSKNLSGNLLVLGSIFCYSAYTIAGKMLVGRWGSTAVTALPFALAAAVFIPVFAWYDPVALQRGLTLSGREWLGVLFLAGIATALGYLGWNWLLRWMSAAELSFYLYLQPLAGAGFSVWLLQEPLTGTVFLGAILIVTAIALGHRSPEQREDPPPGKS